MPLINLIVGCVVMNMCCVTRVFAQSSLCFCVCTCGFLIWGSVPRDIYSPRQKSDIDQSLIWWEKHSSSIIQWKTGPLRNTHTCTHAHAHTHKHSHLGKANVNYVQFTSYHSGIEVQLQQLCSLYFSHLFES